MLRGCHLDRALALHVLLRPRVIRDITASFEMAWDRAIPHGEYKAG
jgi:hypothetical protein